MFNVFMVLCLQNRDSSLISQSRCKDTTKIWLLQTSFVKAPLFRSPILSIQNKSAGRPQSINDHLTAIGGGYQTERKVLMENAHNGEIVFTKKRKLMSNW